MLAKEVSKLKEEEENQKIRCEKIKEKEEKLRKKLFNEETLLRKCKQENEELKKELKLKQKFVFSKQVIFCSELHAKVFCCMNCFAFIENNG